jgi:hypothetical protein
MLDIVTVLIILQLFVILSELEYFLVLGCRFDILTLLKDLKEHDIIRTEYYPTEQLRATELQKRSAVDLGETGGNPPRTKVTPILQ